MGHLDEDILVGHHAAGLGARVRYMIVVQEVAGNAGTLRLPVAPDAHGAMMDVVATESHVDGGVKLDAGDLGSAELLHVVDVVDMVVLNGAEDTAHAADDAGLLAVVDVAAADYVVADILLEPPVILAAADGVTLHLGGTLDILGGKEMVILGVEILAERDAAALTVGYLAILDDPAF